MALSRTRLVSIRTRLYAGAVALFIITTGAVAYVASVQTEEALTEQIEARHVASASGRAARLAALGAAIHEAAWATASDPRIVAALDGGSSDDATAALASRLAENPRISAGFVISQDGIYLFGAPASQNETFAAAFRDQDFQRAIGPAYTAALHSKASHLESGILSGTWTVLTPMRGNGTELDMAADGVLVLLGPALGVLLAGPAGDGADEQGTPASSATEPTDPGFVFIVDDDGVIQTGPDPDDIGTLLSTPFPAVLANPGTTGRLALDGDRYLATAFNVPDTPWAVVLATDEAQAFAPIDALLQQIALVAGAAFVLVLLGTEFASRRLLEPMARLQAGTEQVMHGAYGHQVRISSRDEFQHLAGAFNHMSATIQQQHARLQRTNVELERKVAQRTRSLLEKNREIQDLAYAVSHDLKTPLITMGWILDELGTTTERYRAGTTTGDQHLESDPQLDPWLERLDANLLRMDRLIAEFLDYERADKGAREPVPIELASFVADMVAESEGAIERQQVEVTIGPLPPRIVMDRGHLHVMLGNLLGNALKYGRPKDGNVRIEMVPVAGLDAPDAGLILDAELGPVADDATAGQTQRRPVRDALEWDASGLAPHADPNAAPYWRLEVHDDGPGVSDGDKERVFGIFVRGQDALGRGQSGTGIGLALVRKLARSYDGEAGAADSPLGGALFWVALPSRLIHGTLTPPAGPDATGTAAEVPGPVTEAD